MIIFAYSRITEVDPMSLHVYRTKSDIPTSIPYILSNDNHFSLTSLKNTELEALVLKTVDKAEFVDSRTVQTRTKGVKVPKEYLSTGVKTLLNIICCPDMCFDLAECGNNALCCLPYIHEGHVFWKIPVAICDFDSECDIVCEGKHFTSFFDFLDYCRYGDKEV